MNRVRQACYLVMFAAIAAFAWAAGPQKKAHDSRAKATPNKAVPAKPAPAKSDTAKPETATPSESGKSDDTPYTVKKETIKITLELDGIFEAQKSWEITVKPDEWTQLSVLSALPHGAPVRKDQVVLSLETEKIDRAIADLEADIKLADVGMELAKDQLRLLEKTTPLDLASGQRGAQAAEEDRKSFFDVEKPFALKAIDFNLTMTKALLEYEQEELRQLEKMYKADDITEETEQIVLKRARDSVEKAKFMVEMAQINHDQALKFGLPRMEDQVKDSTERKLLDWEKNKASIPLALQRQRLEMEKLRQQRERSAEKLKKLVADRQQLTVKAPADGIVYYGKFQRGKCSDSANMTESLRPNGAVQPNQVLMTIVEPRPMLIRAAVAEDQLYRLKTGMMGVAVPSGYPALRLPAKVEQVGDVPTAPGSFDARLTFTADHQAKLLMPGMACKVKLVPYLNKEAITVPPKAVHADELDDQKHFVYVLKETGGATKREVTVGEKTDKQTEITTGLAEGDKVLLEAPKGQK